MKQDFKTRSLVQVIGGKPFANSEGLIARYLDLADALLGGLSTGTEPDDKADKSAGKKQGAAA